MITPDQPVRSLAKRPAPAPDLATRSAPGSKQFEDAKVAKVGPKSAMSLAASPGGAAEQGGTAEPRAETWVGDAAMRVGSASHERKNGHKVRAHVRARARAQACARAHANTARSRTHAHTHTRTHTRARADTWHLPSAPRPFLRSPGHLAPFSLPFFGPVTCRKCLTSDLT